MLQEVGHTSINLKNDKILLGFVQYLHLLINVENNCVKIFFASKFQIKCSNLYLFLFIDHYKLMLLKYSVLKGFYKLINY